MAINPVKALLFVAGGAVAAAGTGYVTGAFDGLFGGPPAMTAALPEAGEEQQAAPADAGAGSPAAGQPAPETTGEAEVSPPRFDVVRVEPDGSLVVAGTSAPDSEIELLSGTSMIGAAKANGEGDFALVLDEPLKPGDYQLVLRATTPGGIAATSVETAVVSVPEAESGQVLALVEEPGKPSKFITVPQAAPANDVAAPPASEAEPAPAAAGEAAESPAPASDEQAVAPPQSAGAGAAPAAGQDTAASGELSGDGQAPAETAAEDVKPQSGERVAVAPTESETAAKTDRVAASDARVAVEAIEIEGSKVFIAGSATSGATVRAYANDILLGDAVASGGGRFLIEAERDLPVGDYIVRADLLDPTGAEVLARAAVPFQREAGETVAAVAQPQPETETGATADEPATPEAEAAEPGKQVASSPKEERPAITETLAPRLEPVDGAVIIRRGDTLWHISRRVYGRGIRYSTIYLANQDQIRNPDRIWPGQVFKVPGSTEEGEPADLDALGAQKTRLSATDGAVSTE